MKTNIFINISTAAPSGHDVRREVNNIILSFSANSLEKRDFGGFLQSFTFHDKFNLQREEAAAALPPPPSLRCWAKMRHE